MEQIIAEQEKFFILKNERKLSTNRIKKERRIFFDEHRQKFANDNFFIIFFTLSEDSPLFCQEM